MQEATVRAAALTPPGRGALATVLVDGPGAWELVAAHLHLARGKSIPEHEGATAGLPSSAGNTGGQAGTGRRLVDGTRHFQFGEPLECGERALRVARFGDDPGEQVVVCRRQLDRVEIHCHGGNAAVARILGQLEQAGCQIVAWRQWLARQYADPLSADAALALADAPTTASAMILLDQLQGALRRAIEEIQHSLRANHIDAARRAMEQLLDWASLGRHLVQPWRVAVGGLPNVGKSSLVNAVLGYQRALVHAAPGTTRDLVTAQTAIAGWPVELIDTAGLRAAADPVERAGVAKAETQLASADLVVLVLDASLARTDEEQLLCDRYPAALRVGNKSDLLSSEARIDAASAIGDGLLVSAHTGEGIEHLLAQIARRLVPVAPASGEAVPFTVGQESALRAANEYLEQGRVDSASHLLVQLCSHC